MASHLDITGPTCCCRNWVLPLDPVEETYEDNKHHNGTAILDIERYSTLTKLLYVTAYVLRFIECIKSRGSKPTGPNTASELSMAQMLWIQSCQYSTYLKEITSLQKNQISSRCLPLVRQLWLFLDSSNTLRFGGRIHNVPIDHNTKFPYLLPGDHQFTALIVYATHATQLHGGTNSTITALRQCYWIPAAWRVVAKSLWKCVICRRVAWKLFHIPDPPPLPLARVQDGPPFSVTGVDFTEAISVRNEGFPFLQAFRRFAACRSLPPHLVVSDNVSTYTPAAKELNKLFQSPTLRSALMHKGTV